MQLRSVNHQILRPPKLPRARILFLAAHAPLAPGYACRQFPGDGGYPGYYHRVWQTLRGLGYPVSTADSGAALRGGRPDADLVFSLLNRMKMATPEIFAAANCAYLGLPCVGAPANIRALAEDKWLGKLVAQAIGIPTAKAAIYAAPNDLLLPPPFSGPYFVKNRFGAASEGIGPRSVQPGWLGAAAAARVLMQRGMQVLVEEFAPGLDVTVPVLGGTPPIFLGCVHPRSDKPHGLITEALKRNDPLGYEMYDAGALEPDLRRDAAALWAATGPIDYLRLDYRIEPSSGRRVFLEFNICCHIGRSGAICLAASQFGLTQADVLGHVVEYSLQRQRAAQGAAT